MLKRVFWNDGAFSLAALNTRHPALALELLALTPASTNSKAEDS